MAVDSRYFCRWIVGGFPVRRTAGGRQDLLDAAMFLGEGGIVVVFPEGTRGNQPGELGRFHRGHLTWHASLVSQSFPQPSLELRKSWPSMHGFFIAHQYGWSLQSLGI